MMPFAAVHESGSGTRTVIQQLISFDVFVYQLANGLHFDYRSLLGSTPAHGRARSRPPHRSRKRVVRLSTLSAAFFTASKSASAPPKSAKRRRLCHHDYWPTCAAGLG